jgi:hypothetical protein
MGIALWLGGQGGRGSGGFGFLEGWLGDEFLFEQGPDGAVRETVWLSRWERSVDAWLFVRRAEARLKMTFGDVPFGVSRNGELVTIVWPGYNSREGVLDCERRAAQFAVSTEVLGVSGSFGERMLTALNDLPWPVRFPQFDGFSGGFRVLGGHVVDACKGRDFVQCNVADGLLWRVEKNGDRHYYGIAGGLLRHVEDDRAGLTYWRVPLIAGFLSRREGDSKKCKWRLLCGLGGYGDERSAHVLFIPVWRSEVK